MAFPTTGVLSTFTHSNGALNTASGGAFSLEPLNDGNTDLVVASNQAGQSAGTAGACWWTASTFGPDVEVYVDITATITYLGLYLRLRDPSASASTCDGYLIEYEEGNLEFYPITNGAGGAGLTGGQTLPEFNVGDGFGVSMIDDTIQCYRRQSGVWSTYGSSATDATYSHAGYVGFIMADSASQRIDNFGGGTVVVASTLRQLASAGVGS